MLITIFTPTYNRAHTIHRVYESILHQTLINDENGNNIFEWVIVDDGSTDTTQELIHQWQKKSQFSIRYYYQQNKGKIHAMRKGIEEASGTLFLSVDSDDAFIPATIETFYTIWNKFSDDEKIKCGGIGVLHNDQFGNPIGCDYPVEKKLLYTPDTLFKWRNVGLGDTWAILKTENLKKSFTIPEEAKNLPFIPETFFWDRIVFELTPYTYCLNLRLGIVYRQSGDNISENIREKFAEGFLFESKWFINHYKIVVFKAPKAYFKHLLKYAFLSVYLKKGFLKSLAELDGVLLKFFYIFTLPIAFLLANRYIKGNI